MPFQQEITHMVERHLAVVNLFFSQDSHKIDTLAQQVAQALKAGKKLVICGNGGSAADAQHIAAEYIGRFKQERVSLPAIALTTDSSILTCIGNDYGYDYVFSRQIEGLGNAGDVFIGITTSGNSTNVLEAFHAAKKKNMFTVLLAGKDGGKAKGLADLEIIVPDQETARIQECHIMALHMMCELSEKYYGG